METLSVQRQELERESSPGSLATFCSHIHLLEIFTTALAITFPRRTIGNFHRGGYDTVALQMSAQGHFAIWSSKPKSRQEFHKFFRWMIIFISPRLSSTLWQVNMLIPKRACYLSLLLFHNLSLSSRNPPPSRCRSKSSLLNLHVQKIKGYKTARCTSVTSIRQNDYRDYHTCVLPAPFLIS